MWAERTMVVGTTPDYIEIIRQRYPNRAFFISDRRQKWAPLHMDSLELSELQADLECPGETRKALGRYLERHRIRPAGVACFDCESLGLSADIARDLGLAFPSRAAVDACRNKFLSKLLWREAGLACPKAALVSSEEEAAEFMGRTGGEAVCKPLTGSGSELVLRCDGKKGAREAFRTLQSRMARHPDRLMYPHHTAGANSCDPRRTFLMEELIVGTEYSCDFILDKDEAKIIRLARKIPAAGHCLGTVLAYVVPGDPPPGFDLGEFRSQLVSTGRSLGLDRSICMLDFIIQDGKALLIEMAPRAGGDCLPPLIMESSGLDMLGLSLDLAEGRPVKVPPPSSWRRMIGLHLLCGREGVIRNLDMDAVKRDSRVRSVSVIHGKGHRVVLPPMDYGSRLLGHLIFEPAAGEGAESQCRDLLDRFAITMEADPCLVTTVS